MPHVMTSYVAASLVLNLFYLVRCDIQDRTKLMIFRGFPFSKLEVDPIIGILELRLQGFCSRYLGFAPSPSRSHIIQQCYFSTSWSSGGAHLSYSSFASASRNDLISFRRGGLLDGSLYVFRWFFARRLSVARFRQTFFVSVEQAFTYYLRRGRRVSFYAPRGISLLYSVR